jgi:hypothetical protein
MRYTQNDWGVLNSLVGTVFEAVKPAGGGLDIYGSECTRIIS